MAHSSDIEIVKKGYSKDRYNVNHIDELKMCMSNPIYFCEKYVKVQHPTKGRLPFHLYPYQVDLINAFHRNQYCIALTARQMGKALDLETPILTPTGFTRMGDLQVGDTIYGQDGKTTKIQFITETMNDRECFEIEFIHGEKIIADAEHLWAVELPKRKNQTVTVTTRELIELFEKYDSTTRSIHIKHCETVEFQNTEVPVDPYLLGIWLGDGSHKESGLTCHVDDYPTYVEKIEAAGYRASRHRLDKRSEVTGYFNIAGGFKQALKDLGVYGNKHIPQEFILTSVENRLELLRGLMDNDGSVEKNGVCRFYQSDLKFIESVRFLLSSLGIKTTLKSRETGYKTAYTLCFTTSKFDVFNLPRKLEKQRLNKDHPKNSRIYIRAIRAAKSVPVRCLQVDNQDHLFLCGNTLIPTHNTTCAAAFLLWKAMFEPDTTILIAGNKYTAALEIMDRIRFAYENLEEHNWLRAGVVEYNKGTISFDNGSRIISRATSKDAGRGLSISLLYVDEFAFVAPNKAQEFWSAIQPTLATGGSCIITSTPNHDEDQFAQIWHGANNPLDDHGNVIPDGHGRNGFYPVKVTWEHHPDRDEVWEKQQRAQLGDDIFDRENNCRFISFEETLISPLTLSNLSFKDPIFKIGEIRWFENIKPNHVYTVTLDPSTGTGGDHAAIQVYDLSSLTQVAEWRHHNTVPKGQIEQMMKILYFLYQEMANHPDQVAEPELFWTLENNSVGGQHLQVIEETGEENFPGNFIHEPRRAGFGRRTKGLNTNSRTKMTSAMRFKSLVESGRLKIHSRGLITELKNFVNTGEGFKARPSQTDDLIMSSLLAVRVLEQVAAWDDTLGEALSDAIEADDFDIVPMPFSF